MSRAVCACLLLLLAIGPAHADPVYYDNRSDAAALVRSLYNAINRHEYARAFDYFSMPPAKSFEAFVKGYENTEEVVLAIGTVTGEGTAGTSFFMVPVAIRAVDKNNAEKIFAGCYTVRQVNPAIQEPPFRALLIEKGSLKPSAAGSPEEALPDCGGGTGTQNRDKEQAIEAYLAANENLCSLAGEIRDRTTEPDEFLIKYKMNGSDSMAPETVVKLFRFPCSRYAYNEDEIYFLKRDGEAPEQLSFAEPDLDIAYQDDDGAKLKSMTVSGFVGARTVSNSDYDETSRSITAFSKWRGVGDSSSSATYVFRDGRFLLWNYEADPTTDGEINSVALIKNGKVQ